MKRIAIKQLIQEFKLKKQIAQTSGECESLEIALKGKYSSESDDEMIAAWNKNMELLKELRLKQRLRHDQSLVMQFFRSNYQWFFCGDSKAKPMNTIIISAFPATGKSYLTKNNRSKLSIIDSDSSNFSWLKDQDGNNTKERNVDFPNNYIEHIKSNIGKVDVIFVSSHKNVRTALYDANLSYVLFYPNIKMKQVYLDRFKQRGNEPSFIDFISENWDNFINDCKNQLGCIHVEMQDGFLSNYFNC